MSTPTFEQARALIAALVERFERNLKSYLDPSYKEAQLRQEFLDPFFEALGWDVENKQGFAPQYREVVYEPSLHTRESGTTAPDYSFRIGGTRKFFVEAKKPAVAVKDDAGAAFQLRRYAWSAHLPVSILTDFEEFAVYEARKKPSQSDKASVERVNYLTYKDYVARLEEIWSVFSKEAVLKGDFDRFAGDVRKKRGTAEVDGEFLKEIEDWREELARNFALRNPKLTVHELNHAVQATIDRILFLRIAEDRGAEEYGRLQGLMNGANIYPRLTGLYTKADAKYNAGLFDFSPDGDRLTLALKLDDKVLKGIIGGLYYPDCPYEFSVFSADILGSVYERFLGKVIRLTKGHQAKVEDKPEVKKAGGVYYTPAYIVEYIVSHTVGELIKGKSPRQVEKLKILDPACGSGSFLLGAYQKLLDYHLDWYTAHNPEKRRNNVQKVATDAQGQPVYRLTTAEKKRITLNNIFGVDIDPQAVEVAKLNLLLKVMEGETEETIRQNMVLFQERALPNLDNNIKCGNSLIGTDFYSGQQMKLLDEEERYRINAFNWESEFTEIMKGGGFDAVIGNPPYVSFYSRESIKPLAEVEAYLARKFEDHVGGRLNSFLLFLAQSLRLKSISGYLSMIVPDTLASNESYERTRSALLDVGLCSVSRLDFPVFALPTVRVVIPVVGFGSNRIVFALFADERDFLDSKPRMHVLRDATSVKAEAFARWPFTNLSYGSILRKMEADSVPLSTLAETRDGINPGTKSFRERILNPSGPAKQTWRPVLEGRHITRFYILPSADVVDYDPSLLTKELKRKGASLRDPRVFVGPKLVNRQTADNLVFALDVHGYCTLNSAHNTRALDGSVETLLYLLGILNSRLMRFYYREVSQETRDVFPQVHISTMRQLPIPRTADGWNHENRPQNRIVGLVNHMNKRHEELHAASTRHARELIQRQIDATDQEIDQLVYELYGLTPEEIELVEAGK